MKDHDLKALVLSWIKGDTDESSQQELQALLDAERMDELRDRMAGPLEFGTAGLRGVLGAGNNRMNRAVIIQTTAGLAKYLLAHAADATSRGVVVGYDGRRMSREFAEETARVLAGFGIVAHLFPTLCTTPQTAFAVVELRAVAGIMVTASHNPPEYNGYKVYWDNGAQIIPPHDKGISAQIALIAAPRDVPRPTLDDARGRSLVRDVPDAVTDTYLKKIGELRVHSAQASDLKIVYTPMHGTGQVTARKALAQAGFTNVTSVPEQAEPDGEFPTVRFPNPEEPGALDLSTGLASRLGADIVIANDPDADRLSVAIPAVDGNGWCQLTGNQVGILFGHYLIADHPNPGSDRLVVTTIVSSPALGVIARAHKVRYEEVLTGFKWIANRAMDVERETGTEFVFGYEEALGYTIGQVVRDKDGVGAAAVFAELTAFHRSQGRSIHDALERISRAHGLFASRQKNIVSKGLDGAARISAMMTQLRSNPPSSIAGRAVLATSDYLRQTRIEGGVATPLQLPPSNVLAFELDGGHRIVARPSGTEPKIKFYFDVRQQLEASQSMVQAQAAAEALLDSLETAFVQLVN